MLRSGVGVSDAYHARYIGIRDSTVRGVIGHFGADVTAAAGKYTISAVPFANSQAELVPFLLTTQKTEGNDQSM